ncbi:heavy metal translocating P-type ATPase [Listeria sp. ILCC792]|uniref:heavy metal translocating P-type ATPase n=1 Tax=Listeria sp. ILCC792 TaxID=1918331 RepID=UPI000B5969B2|nr:heavy metal translocating P-type ATPase [Listeria sp. ILCC792]
MQKIRENVAFIATAVSGILILIGWQLEGKISEMGIAIIFITAFIIGGFEQAKSGILDTIKTHKLNVELLMVLAATGASIIGYWLEGAVLIFIFSLSGALETYTTNKSKRELTKLMALKPKTAFLQWEKGELTEVPVGDLAIGNLILVRPGERVPIDGVICGGETTVDESAINGESMPKEKSNGADVFGGTVNLTGAVTVSVSKTEGETLFSQIIQMVQDAENQPSETAAFIERFEDKYVKAVLVLVGIMLFLPHFALGWTWNETFYRAMVLLTVASPCALVASVTPATLAAISNGARHGILFKGGVHLEHLKRVRAVAFDKTGTLTRGTPSLTDFILETEDQDELLNVVYTLEKNSTHPLARAISDALGRRGATYLQGLVTEDVPGFGVQAAYAGHNWKVGKARFIGAENTAKYVDEYAENLAKEGKTIVYVAKDNLVVAVLALRDEARREAVRAISALKSDGIQTVMVTGDNEETGLAIGREIGIDYVIAGCLPENKVAVMNDLKATYGSVCMVGDGINDAPALAHATVGVAMGEGTDIAMEAADIVLMKNDLEKLAYARKLSVRLSRIVKQNIFFSIAVIISLVILNVFQSINLPFGVIGHEGSTILVILNGLRLLLNNRKSRQRTHSQTGEDFQPKIYVHTTP